MSAATTSVVFDLPCYYPHPPHPLPRHLTLANLRQINSLLLSDVSGPPAYPNPHLNPLTPVTPSPVFALLFKPLEAVVKMLSFLALWCPVLVSAILAVLTQFRQLIQLLLLYPFFEIRRSVHGEQIFWEYASVTFSIVSSIATFNSTGSTRLILERVMPAEQWGLLMLMVGLIQFLVIPLGSNRARAVACVLCLLIWGPLFLVFMRRVGIIGPVPGYIVFAFGNYLHVFTLLRNLPGDPLNPPNLPIPPSQEPPWTQPTPTSG